MMEAVFSTGELEELERASAQEAGTGFFEIVGKYRHFVDGLPDYDFSIYEYDNDLSVRTTLDRILEACNPQLRHKASSYLEELDQVFLQRTVEVKRAFGDTSIKWNSRLPIDPRGELREDIENGNV